jgi:hypothetical protein
MDKEYILEFKKLVGKVNEQASSYIMTILKQLGGFNKLESMIGAHSFTYEGSNSLTFKFKAKANKNIKAVRITLNDNDTYTMEFYSLSPFERVDSYSDVYAEDLKRIFKEVTGLSLSLSENVSEGSVGILDGDQSDVLFAIVMKNKHKSSVEILRIARQDDIFSNVDDLDMMEAITSTKDILTTY